MGRVEGQDRMLRVCFVSMGCVKNLVDTETLAGIFAQDGFEISSIPSISDIIIITTCSFIEEAREENFAMIRKMCSLKKPGQKIIVAGCMAHSHGREVFEKFPQVDGVFGFSTYRKLPEILKNLKSRKIFAGKKGFLNTSSMPRLLATPNSYAYLKIADGCSNNCAYCKIPSIRGPYKSRNLSDILKEARMLSDYGIKELILIANDTAFYGKDKGMFLLKKLLKEISKTGFEWIRVLYMHPSHISDEIIEAFAENKNILPYFEIPLQHTDDTILRKMKREPFSKAIEKIEKIKKALKNPVFRTTFIVGFPGETEKKFLKLVEDMKKLKFHWVSFFKYSAEKGTPAFSLRGKVPEEEKERRIKYIQDVQAKITVEKNRHFVGKKLKILIDAPHEGHAFFQAPEVDGKILFSKKQKTGAFKEFLISGVDGYDLFVG